MTDYDRRRETLKRLNALLAYHQIKRHPNYWIWHDLAEALRAELGKPQHAPTPIQPPTGYPPANTPRTDGIRRQNAEIKGVRL